MATTVRQLELFTRTAPGNLRGGELFHLLRHALYIELANTLEDAVLNAVLKKPSNRGAAEFWRMPQEEFFLAPPSIAHRNTGWLARVDPLA